ncbi:hypothetical protein [Anderseniella sp. Alg231-50]|uniref:hypothetical protein n=1 Tax=Anderseniella sp. Alg231-50 TaxID=1922226 RepID=UPI000D54D487
MLQVPEKTQAAQAETRRLKIGWNGVHWIVDVAGCGDLFSDLQKILRGWDIVEQPVTATIKPAMVFSRMGDVYDWRLPANDLTAENLFGCPESNAGAVRDFHFLFNGWFGDEFQQYFTLHCAAVKVGDGVILFPGGHRAGKSLLTVALAANGHTVFGDDVVAIDPVTTEVLSLGLLPRIRLPLPLQAITSELRQTLNKHSILGDAEQQYIDLAAGQMAEVGRSSPVKAIVQLKRTNKTGAASLDDMTNGAALRSLISQNYSTGMPASSVFDHLHKIVEGASCHCMTYHKVDDAASLLEAVFDCQPGDQSGVGQ